MSRVTFFHAKKHYLVAFSVLSLFWGLDLCTLSHQWYSSGIKISRCHWPAILNLSLAIFFLIPVPYDTSTISDINLHTRVKVAEARVRSRLTYALQSDRLTGRQCRTVDSVWMRMLRSMVRGGFARNGLDSTRFTLSNASILSTCNTQSASSFCQQQHLRYLAYVCRMENDTLQKQLLFAPPRKKEVSHWKRLANDYKIHESQLRRTLFNKKAVNELL